MAHHIIGLTGPIGVGKTLTAAIIRDELSITNFQVFDLAFADPVKEIAQVGFVLTKEWLRDVNKNVVHPAWGITPRQMFQIVGTDFFVDRFGDQHWIKNLAVRHDEAIMGWRDTVTIVTDVRNITGSDAEAHAIRIWGGTVVHIKGPQRREEGAAHVSNTPVACRPHDLTLDNSGDDTHSLRLAVRALLKQLEITHA